MHVVQLFFNVCCCINALHLVDKSTHYAYRLFHLYKKYFTYQIKQNKKQLQQKTAPNNIKFTVPKLAADIKIQSNKHKEFMKNNNQYS